MAFLKINFYAAFLTILCLKKASGSIIPLGLCLFEASGATAYR